MEPNDPFSDCNLFRPGEALPEFRPEWRTEAVVGLLKGIVEDGAFERMPILADALEEAGCDDRAMLDHCRAAVPHQPGCWVLDLIRTAEFLRLIGPTNELPVSTPPLPRRNSTAVTDKDTDSLLHLALGCLAVVVLGGGLIALFLTSRL